MSLRKTLQLFGVAYLLDTALFFLIPLGVSIDGNACTGWAVGCARGGYAFTSIPSFSVAVHETIHTLGFHEEYLPLLANLIIWVVLLATAWVITDEPYQRDTDSGVCPARRDVCGDSGAGNETGEGEVNAI